MTELVTLVDEEDRAIGQGEKLDVHRRGLLHRAFSVFLFDARGQFLLQKRAVQKYHSGGLWTNACCGHPRPGEAVQDAAHRRLREEMGFDCAFEKVASFTYHAELPGDLVEYEYDHVFAGVTDIVPTPDPEEASDWKWVEPAQLFADVAANPDHYTVWFKSILGEVFQDRAHPSPDTHSVSSENN